MATKWPISLLFLSGLTLLGLVAWSLNRNRMDIGSKQTVQYETVQVDVDDSTIAKGDHWAVIHPVWWSANIYGGPEEYERSLLPFSRSQRLVFALVWYESEVNNGGHRQFYGNSTGIVWKDALAACQAMELSGIAEIIEESANRIGGSPSLDRKKRNEQLTTLAPNFKDLDDRFYASESKIGLDERIVAFIRARPNDFRFSGKIRRTVLPGRKN